MTVLHRVALPFINSLFITAVLFGFMYSLIDMEEPELSSSITLPAIKISNIPEEEPPTPIMERIKKPKEVELPPALPKVAKLTNDDPVGPTIWPSYNPPVVKGGGNLPIDNQLVIAIGFPPEYPNGALTRGIEGYAVVGFSVSAAGSVFDSYILESEPKGVFDRASLKAIAKFKYRARKVNGRPVSTDGQRYMFTFKLETP